MTVQTELAEDSHLGLGMQGIPHNGCTMEDVRIRYALSILLGEPGPRELEWPRWFGYAQPGKQPAGTKLLIVPSGLFGPRYGTRETLPRLPLADVEGTPLLYGEPRIERHGETLVVYADILASAYYLLTRYEEWVRSDTRDAHGRFPGRESVGFRAGFLDRPIVEEYSDLLRRWASEAGCDICQPSRRFSVLLTHDIDSLGVSRTPMQLLRSAISPLLGRQSWQQARSTISIVLGLSVDLEARLDYLYAMDRRVTNHVEHDRCESIYFFMAGGRSPFDHPYSIRSRKVRRSIAGILSAGGTIGLHSSYEAGGNPHLVAAERAVLEEVAGEPIYRNRHHFLRWREPSDGAAIAAAGISWDSTMGYADVAGFRLGICHPVLLFDPAKQELLRIEEHPLIVMDVTLSSPHYMNLDFDAALDTVCRLASAVRRHNGEFVVLWHNYMFSAGNHGYHRRLYARVLEHLGEIMGSQDASNMERNTQCGL